MTPGLSKAADTAAAVSIPVWAVSLAAEALPIVQFIAGVLAIVASVFAIVVHWKRLRRRE